MKLEFSPGALSKSSIGTNDLRFYVRMSGQVGIPYVDKPYRIQQTSRRMHVKEGVTIPIDRHAWLTNGPVRSIEAGLPLISETPMARSYNDALQSEKRIKSLQTDCLKTFFKEGEYKDDFQIQREAPIETRDERQMRVLMEKIVAKDKKKLADPPTGLVAGQPARDIIDSMGHIHLRSVTLQAKRPDHVSPFPRPTHPKQRKQQRPKSTVALVRSQLKRVFRPGEEPFTNIDSEADFPLDGIEPVVEEPREEEEEETTSDTIDYNREHYESKLIDTSDKEIFWTKNMAPFTKKEIDMLYSWRKQGNDAMDATDRKGERLFKRREGAIKRTFQSKLAFRRELQLVDQDCSEIVNLGPGRMQRNRESPWQAAARFASRDTSSLPYRKAKWKDFVEFVKANGGAASDLQKKFVMEYRKELLTGHPVGTKMLWNILDKFDEMNFTEIPLLRFVEFVRASVGVSKDDLIEYFSRKDVPKYFYDLAVQQTSPLGTSRGETSARKSKLSSRICVPRA